MPKFYFTYGRSERFPYQGGWTEVEAPDQPAACTLFMMFHPNHAEDAGRMNYARVYTEEAFAATKMSGPGGNFGAFCRELIMVHREEFGPQDRDG